MEDVSGKMEDVCYMEDVSGKMEDVCFMEDVSGEMEDVCYMEDVSGKMEDVCYNIIHLYQLAFLVGLKYLRSCLNSIFVDFIKQKMSFRRRYD